MRVWAFALPSLFLVQQGAQAASNHRSSVIPEENGQQLLSDQDTHQDTLGAVASESSICSQIGIDVLKAGGNAADSMVATTFCVGVIGMYHSGIGGGGFALIRDKNGEYEFIDFRESAPAASTQDMFVGHVDNSTNLGLKSGVPGELRGLAYIHEHHGSLPWEQLVMPAVHIARHGFPVTEDFIRYTKNTMAHRGDWITGDPSWAIDFAPNGTLLGLGDTMTRKRYANTLETIAQHGPETFYSGPIANATIHALQAKGGIMTLRDLSNYQVLAREPAQITYRNYKIHAGTAPSSGIVALSTLKLFEGLPHPTTPSNLSTHLLDEAIRFGQGQRTELGDPTYLPHLTPYQHAMLHDSTLAPLRAKISPNHTLNISDYNPSGYEMPESPGTSALVTSDASGLSISLTTTINNLYGNLVLVPETGILLNDEMGDFSTPGQKSDFGYYPCPSNYIRPGKRPMSSITPVIVETADDNAPYYVVAAAGGSRILTATLQQLWHVLDQNMTVLQALRQPRFHDQLVPDRVEFEWGYDNSTVAFMRERQHAVTWVSDFGRSAVQALRRWGDGSFEAAGEPRHSGSAGLVV
ncbi:gamma-glutamyltranspeptidase-like protein [Teratosphaeria nubilosa]|uniref:Glutathione hydrolase n=1 Tax=Teratosphaeria nubilosa TaxID=161662 RepID=A0A6G1L8K3_9PEZI|nr:gamma-glutamyltranspeptidase-like protein [Teratosphaeria nubilosa]